MNKIIHIVSSLNVGGAEKFVKNLSIEQEKRKENVKVVSFGCPDEPFQGVLAKHQISVINLSGGLFSRLKQFLILISKVDIIHIHSPSVIRAFLPIFPFLIGKKVIYTIHGEVDPPQGQLKLAHQVALLYLDQIVAVSLPAKNSVTARYGWSNEKVNVIKNGVNSVGLVKNRGNEGKVRFGVVSRLIPLKNIALLLNVLAQLPTAIKANLSLEIFGDGSEKKALVENVEKNNLKELVTFHGNVIEEQAIYSSFDVLVMCSNTEGLPMSILEAMGFSIPVISTDVGAISQVIEDGNTGWLYQAKDGKALSRILVELIEKPDKLIEAGYKAQQFIDANYAISDVCNDYQKVYNA